MGAQTFIAALRCDGLTVPWVINGLMNRTIFETYVETQLAPTLQPADAVFLDNLSSRKSKKTKTILKERGAWFLFLPPYSPNLNPIAIAFAKLKAHLRFIGAPTIEELRKVVGSICNLYTPEECWNDLKHAGYAGILNAQSSVCKNECNCCNQPERLDLPLSRYYERHYYLRSLHRRLYAEQHYAPTPASHNKRTPCVRLMRRNPPTLEISAFSQIEKSKPTRW